MTTPRRSGRPAGRCRRGHRALLAGSALAGLLSGASAAYGQAAFRGTPSYTSGSVTYSSPNANTDVYTVGGASTIIDWTPADNSGSGTIAFLPAGKTGIFQSNTSANFTVLNRINPMNTSRPVQFDGTVTSQYVNAAAGTTTPGGSIFFYTPGGIIVGATAKFSVGSLILTTNAIDTTNGVPDPTSGIRFTGTSGSTSAIVIQPDAAGRTDAQISAPNAGSYVALVAPRITQGGVVDVNGSVGYVAAEAAVITINAGLFAISDAVGAQVATGGETTLTHTGTTTGPASAGAGDPHVIYMVTVPKNDAVTMLVSGNVGYQAAFDASIVNGQIVLGAGYTNNSATFDPPAAPGFQDSYATALGGGQPGAIRINAGTYSSPIYAYSNGSFLLSSAAGNVTAQGLVASANLQTGLDVLGGNTVSGGVFTLFNFPTHGVAQTASVDVTAGSTLSLTGLAVKSPAGLGITDATIAETGNAVTMDVSGTATLGFLDLVAYATGAGGVQTVKGGSTAVTIDGGNLTVTAAATYQDYPSTFLWTSAYVDFDDVNSASSYPIGQIQAGTASLKVMNGGTANLADVRIVACARSSCASYGATPGAITGIGGTIDGGTALVQASSGGAITISGPFAMGAAAYGRSDVDNSARVQAGTASLLADGGTVTLTGSTTATIDTSATGGTATGGTALTEALNGGTLTIAGGAILNADATGDDTPDGVVAGSAGRAGTASLIATGGTVSLSSLELDANAIGGSGEGITTAGSALGGNASVTAGIDGGGRVGAITAGTVSIYSNASAGVGTNADLSSQGGQTTVRTTGGTIGVSGRVVSDANAAGGAATGGTALVDGAAGTIDVTGYTSISASATGEQSTTSGTRYAATGGTAQIDAAAGVVNLGQAGIYAAATGGSSNGGIDGGDATGGTARITTTGSAGSITTMGVVSLEADGFASAGVLGLANGTGGTTEVVARGGRIQFNDDPSFGSYLSMIPDGLGGSAAVTGRDVTTSGIGRGGTVRLIADDGGSVSIAGSAYLSPYADGSGGVSGTSGGEAIGGSVTVGTGLIDGGAGTISFGSMDIDLGAFGGAIYSGGGANGGNAVAGAVSVVANAGGMIGGTTLTIENYANGGGSSSGTTAGGSASGGTTNVTAAGGTISLGDSLGNGGLTIADTNTGGAGYDGSTGGAAIGGATIVSASDGGQLLGSTWTIGGAATGGAGGYGVTGAGGVGGDASGGAVSLTVSGGTATIATLAVTSTNTGGAGGAGLGFTTDPNNPTVVQNGFAGGTGGTAEGGTAAVTLSGGTLGTSALSVTTVAAGGVGGAGGGGAGISSAGVAGAGGIGGAGGVSSGGMASLATTGGVVTTSGTTLTSGSTTGASAGGAGGTGADGVVAAGGAQGGGAGGAVSLGTDDSGSLSLGAAQLTADALSGSDGDAGAITISAADSDGTAPATPITIASLTASNVGLPSGNVVQLTAATPITITGDATFNSGTPIHLDVTGNGTLAVGGALSITANGIASTQTGAPSGLAAISAGSAMLNAGGNDIDLAGLTTTGGDLTISAGGQISATTLTSAGSLTAEGGGDLTIGTATAALDLQITAQTSIDVTTAVAGRDAGIYTIIAGDDTSIRPRNVVVGSVTAGDDAVVTAWGSVTANSITTTGLGEDGTDSTFYGNVPGSGVILYGGKGIKVGSLTTLSAVTAINNSGTFNGVLQSAGTGGVEIDRLTTSGTVTASSQFDRVSLPAITASSVSATGTSVSIGSPGALTISSASSTAGDISIQSGGDLSLPDIVATGGGITLASGGAISFVTLTADEDIGVSATGALTGTSQTSNHGAIEDAAGGLVDIASLSAGDSISVKAGATGQFQTLTSGTDPTESENDGSLDFGTIAIRTAGDLAIADAVDAYGSIGLLSNGGIATAALTAGHGGGIGVLANGPIALGTVTAPSLLYVGGPAAVASGNVGSAADILQLLRSEGPVASGGAVSLAGFQAGNAILDAGTSLDSAGSSATLLGNAVLMAGGDLRGGDITSFGGIDATSAAGAISTGLLTGSNGNVTVSSAAGPVTIAGANAADTVTLTTPGLLTINGATVGDTIALASADIAIASGASIGAARTTSVAFSNIGTGRTMIGAAGTSGDYQLSASELGAVHAATISIAAGGTAGANSPAVVIGDVALAGSAAASPNLIGDGGTFAVTTPGALQLVGQLALTGAGAGNRISLTAGSSITGILPAAGIAITDPGGALAGTIALTAGRIEFDTPDVAQAVASASTTAARSTALAANDGTVDNDGYIRAKAVAFAVGSALYTQNSGATSSDNADRAGVTAGTGVITIASSGTNPIDVVLNARIEGASATSTGADVVGLVQSGSFASGSTVNGCLADGTPCGTTTTTPPTGTTPAVVSMIAQASTPPIQDVVQVVTAQAAATSSLSSITRSSAYSFQTPELVSFAGLPPAGLAPLIDVPVTGAGNDDLWVNVGVSRDPPATTKGNATPK